MVETVLVVSDVFKEFCVLGGVLSYSEFLAFLETDDQYGFPEDRIYVLSQGLDKTHFQHISEILAHRPAVCQRQVLVRMEVPADKALVHKSRSENVLISAPQKEPDGTYTARLLINDGCAEISDHVTGCHVQGMVLLEAARQMMISASDIHFRQKEVGQSYYYVFDEMTVRYMQFVFPVEIEIRLRFVEANGSERFGVSAVLDVQLEQMREVVCSVGAIGRGYSRTFMKKIEKRRAARVINEVRTKTSNRDGGMLSRMLAVIAPAVSAEPDRCSDSGDPGAIQRAIECEG